MVELRDDPCVPSELVLPRLTTAEANAISGLSMVSGMIIYNTTLNKAEIWTGSLWETVTSVAR